MVRRRIFPVILGATGLAFVVSAFAACDDSATPDTDPTLQQDGGDATDAAPDRASRDGGELSNDAGANPKADAESDAESDADAGPTVSKSLGPTGWVQIRDAYMIGQFYEDDAIVRFSNSPECVVHVRSASKPMSPAGTITMGGPVVGTPGGLAAPVDVEPDETNQYFFVADPPDVPGIFAPDGVVVVTVQGGGTVSFPPMPGQSLPSPPAGPIEFVTSIPADESQPPLVVPADKDFELAWTPPAGARADHKVIFSVQNIDSTGSPKRASLHCGFPLAAGKGVIPANLVAELKLAVPGSTALSGLAQITAGGYAEYSGGASYVVEVARDDIGSVFYVTFE